MLDQILFGGVYDIVSLNHYAHSDSFSGNSFIFYFVICAVFTYIELLQKKFIDSEKDGFAYRNAIAYITCLLVYYLFLPIYEKVHMIYSTGSILIKFIIICLFAVLILLPSLISILRVSLYSTAAVFLTEHIIMSISTFPVMVIILSLVSVVIIWILDNIFDVIMDNILSGISKRTGRIKFFNR